MKDILIQFYRGEIRPDQDGGYVSQEMEEVQRSFERHQNKLLEKLDEPLKERMQAVLEENTEVTAYEMEDAYLRGMRMGAKLTAALLCGE